MGGVITLISGVFCAIAWQGNFESWVANPGITPMAHAVRDSHFGTTAAAAFSASIVSTTGVYEWYYTIGLRSVGECVQAVSFSASIASFSWKLPARAGNDLWAVSTGEFVVESSNPQIAVGFTLAVALGLLAVASCHFLGTASLAWAGHLAHVAWTTECRLSAGDLSLVAIPKAYDILASWSDDQWNHVFGVADSSVGTRPIHRPAPAYVDLDTTRTIFETGIKVVDGCATYKRGGKIDLFGGAGEGKTVFILGCQAQTPCGSPMWRITTWLWGSSVSSWVTWAASFG